jgi:hypothetical protein
MTIARSLTFAASSPLKLHRQLIAELSPKGMLEHDVVATIARLVWRKQRSSASLSLLEGVVRQSDLNTLQQP